MDKSTVGIVRYEQPLASVRKVVELCRGFENLPANAKVFIKPNIVLWTRLVPFPKWGVITTSRVVEDVVVLLKEHGVQDITIGEGSVSSDPKDKENPAHAFRSLGYDVLKKRYGVNYMDVFDRPFEKVDLGDGITLKFNADALHSDFVVDLPVLKTHAVTMLSLGIKNLKGLLDIPSRKKCHSADPEKNLHFMVSKLANPFPRILTILDGIYTNERGPAFDGRMRRSNILAASTDVLSADMVGAKILGYEPSEVPHLLHAARDKGRPLDLSDIDVKGERIEDVASRHEYDFPFNEDNTLPMPFVKKGMKGLSYRKYDSTLCTYCTAVNGAALMALAQAWNGNPWDEVEVLTGKAMKPTPGMKKTILLGKCMYQANKDHPDIQEMIPIKGCPPSPKAVVKAFHQAGIEVDPAIFDNMERMPGLYMKRYADKPEFEEAFFHIE